jgi:hypothetical protein
MELSMTTYADHLAEVENVLALLEQHACQATAIVDAATPAEVRPHIATLATGIAKARMQLTFVMRLMDGHAHRAPTRN